MTTLDTPRLPATSCPQPPDAGGIPALRDPTGESNPIQRLADASVWLVFRLSGVRS